MAPVWLLFLSTCTGEKKDQYFLDIHKVEEYSAHVVSEGLAVGVEMIRSDVRSHQIFEYKNLVSSGIVPVLVVIENRGENAVEISGENIYLTLVQEKVAPLELREIAGILKANKKSPGILRSPIPIPSFSGNDSKMVQLESRSFQTKRIPPGVSDHGFVFFHSYTRRIGEEARFLYFPKITNLKTGEDMIYLEVPLIADQEKN